MVCEWCIRKSYRMKKLKSYRYYKNHILKHVVKSSKPTENIIYSSTVEAYRMNTYPPKLPSIENSLKSIHVPLNLKKWCLCLYQSIPESCRAKAVQGKMYETLLNTFSTPILIGECEIPTMIFILTNNTPFLTIYIQSFRF